MAAILRSSVIQTVRRAFSGEGTLSVRTPHTGRNNPMAYASCAKENLKPAEVELLTKPIVGKRRGSVSHYSTRPTRLKKDVSPWFVGIFVTLAFLEGIGEGDDDKQHRRSK